MTIEERNAHGEEICNRYILHISPDKNEVMDEISKLPIQDIITIYANAELAMVKGMLQGITKESLAHVKRIIVERLITVDILWTVTDKITNAPYIDDSDNVWIFTEKEFAEECVDYFVQQKKNTLVVTEIQGEKVKFFAHTAYEKGAKTFRIDMGAYSGIIFQRNELAQKSDLSDINQVSPVMNPDFSRTVIKLQQERLYKFDYQGKQENLRKFENDMIVAFHNAQFLVPVKGAKGLVDKNDGIIDIPKVYKGEGENQTTLVPVFTDWNELYKVFPKEKGCGGCLWSPEDLLNASEDVIVVNAASLGFEMSKNMIQQMREIYKTEIVSENKSEEKTEIELQGTFTVMARFTYENAWSSGPVECKDLLEAMMTQIGFLKGTPLERSRAIVKKQDVQRVKTNLLSYGRDCLHSENEESWICFKPEKGKTGDIETMIKKIIK